MCATTLHLLASKQIRCIDSPTFLVKVISLTALAALYIISEPLAISLKVKLPKLLVVTPRVTINSIPAIATGNLFNFVGKEINKDVSIDQLVNFNDIL